MAKGRANKLTDEFLNSDLKSSTFKIITVGDDVSSSSDIKNSLYLTGAADPVLPMVISVAGKDNIRTSFIMLINPETLNHSKTNSTQLSYARTGYISQLWGPNQDTLTSTGRTAAFMVGKEGLTGNNKRYSFAYRNFAALFMAYKNNGHQIVDTTIAEGIEREITRVIDVVNGVEVYYDNQVFMGHFNNFTLDDSAEQPYIFNYNFEFILSSETSDYSQVRGHFCRMADSKAGTSVLISDIYR